MFSRSVPGIFSSIIALWETFPGTDWKNSYYCTNANLLYLQDMLTLNDEWKKLKNTIFLFLQIKQNAKNDTMRNFAEKLWYLGFP